MVWNIGRIRLVTEYTIKNARADASDPSTLHRWNRDVLDLLMHTPNPNPCRIMSGNFIPIRTPYLPTVVYSRLAIRCTAPRCTMHDAHTELQAPGHTPPTSARDSRGLMKGLNKGNAVFLQNFETTHFIVLFILLSKTSESSAVMLSERRCLIFSRVNSLFV